MERTPTVTLVRHSQPTHTALSSKRPAKPSQRPDISVVAAEGQPVVAVVACRGSLPAGIFIDTQPTHALLQKPSQAQPSPSSSLKDRRVVGVTRRGSSPVFIFIDTQTLLLRQLTRAGSLGFVSLMEGNIWIESDGLGKGCTAIFLVKLGIPERLNKAMIPFAPKQLSAPIQSSFLGLKVLVMDENGVSRTVTKGLLMHLGCDVTTVGSSEECLLIVSREFKVVFLDVCVPGADGYEVAVQIRKRFSKRHERPLIVAITGSTDRVTRDNCLRVGMDGFVLKPVSVDKMRNVLCDLLEGRTVFEGL